MSSLLVHCEYFQEFKKFIIKICKPFSLKIGWEAQENEGNYNYLFNQKSPYSLMKLLMSILKKIEKYVNQNCNRDKHFIFLYLVKNLH